MNQEDRSKLEDLKEQVLNSLVGLADSEGLSAEQRYQLYINSANISGNFDSFKKAFEAASQFEESSAKANAMMDLLEEIDVQLGNITEGELPPEQKKEDSAADQPQQSE